MIIDLPPQTEQAIIARAEQQGLTVKELLMKDYSPKDDFDFILDEIERHGLNSDDVDIILNEQDANIVQALLDNPPTPNPYMQKLIELGKKYV